MPLPNKFTKEDSNKEDFYPLSCVICQNCKLVQLDIIINPKLMFSDYPYIPSTSKVMMNNFTNLAYETIEFPKIKKGSLVIDIGSNDGSLLEIFNKHGFQVLGVDPAKNLAKVAIKKGIPTKISQFNLQTAKDIKNKHGHASLITATNVVAHIHNLNQLLKGVNLLIGNDGKFITEFPYLLDLVEKQEFDTIYHEHLSYFSLKPWMYIINKYGLEIVDVKRLNIHGGTIRVTHRKKRTENENMPSNLKFLLDLEEKAGLYNNLTYINFTKKIEEKRYKLLKLLNEIKKDGKKIIGIGAAAKGNILTNFFDIGPDIVDYIIDSTSYKHYCYTPGKKIPIFPEDKISSDDVHYALILAWNFKDEIIRKHKDFKKKGGRFILPIPEVIVI